VVTSVSHAGGRGTGDSYTSIVGKENLFTGKGGRALFRSRNLRGSPKLKEEGGKILLRKK